MTQKEIAKELGFDSTTHIRDLIHSMRVKGWGVLSDSNGMCRSESRTLKDRQAAALLARAKSIIDAAEGLVRKDQDELDINEQMLWLLLPEKKHQEEEIKTSFEYITEEELKCIGRK